MKLIVGNPFFKLDTLFGTVCRGDNKTFAGRYFCYNLIYFEKHDTALGAIEGEKEIKDWSRQKKEDLIATENPAWKFLNSEVTDWPPHPDVKSRG